MILKDKAFQYPLRCLVLLYKEKEMTLINMSSPSSIYDIFSVKGVSLLY